MKVSKEGIVGLVAAVKRYLRTDQTARLNSWDKKADYIISQLLDCKSVTVRKVIPVNVDHPRPMIVPKVEMTPSLPKLTAEFIEKETAKGRSAHSGLLA